MRLTQLLVAAIVVAVIAVVANSKIKGQLPDANSSMLENLETSTAPEAPELQGIALWLNSEPLMLNALKGKVVLIDFWTYSCINCIRTLPYLHIWHDKYKDAGLVVIGVHSPEFEFEKNAENVKKAVQKYNVTYPVALDNEHQTWKAFKNNFWPRKYLIDVDGKIRYDHIGEGAYEETEKVIQQLLGERLRRMNEKVQLITAVSVPDNAVSVDFSRVATPELYLGFEFALPRGMQLGNSEGFQPGHTVNYTLNYSAPSVFGRNLVYLDGQWTNNPDHIELVSDEGVVFLKYAAKAVNIVAGTGNNNSGNNSSAVIGVFIDEEPVRNESKGWDVQIEGNTAIVVVIEHRLYNVIFGKDYATRLLKLSVKGKGFRLYTFTFG